MTSVRRHVPLRTCISCGNKAPKRDLMRIVSTPEFGVKADQTGKVSGRGTYVCSDVQCAPTNVRRGRIENALKGPITDSDWEVVAAVITTRGIGQP
jgi:predicted RNA-binding protein YlxR (DUF448 family)